MSSTQTKPVAGRTIETVRQELEQAQLARDGASGRVKGNMTRVVKKLSAELADLERQIAPEPAPTEPKVKLADLEAQVIATLREQGIETPTVADIAKVGDPIVAAGRLAFYRAERWDDGRWVSAAVLRRIRAAVQA